VRDEGRVRPPQGTLMLCPWTDMICERYPSFQRNGPKGVMYDSAFCGYVRSMYSPPWLWTHPYVSPMWANLERFGPAFILAAGEDLLADENRIFHDKLIAAGNESEFFQHDSMPHAYYYFLGLAPEIEEAYVVMVAWLRKVLSIEKDI
jgi:acetyl esterase